jgi:uncharacterized protein (TIGR02266 family)
MDKREAVRIPVRVQAQCRSSDMVIDGLVEDVSRSGLFLRSPTYARPGSQAELDLTLPDEQRLRLNAEVVRVETDPGRAGMGLRFVNQREASRRPLANFMMRVHAIAD